MAPGDGDTAVGTSSSILQLTGRSAVRCVSYETLKNLSNITYQSKKLSVRKSSDRFDWTKVIFISHNWIGNNHPDNQDNQFLGDVLRMIEDNGHQQHWFWIDWFCYDGKINLEWMEMLQGVIKHSSFVYIVDYNGYESRGWCALEYECAKHCFGEQKTDLIKFRGAEERYIPTQIAPSEIEHFNFSRDSDRVYVSKALQELWAEYMNEQGYNRIAELFLASANVSMKQIESLERSQNLKRQRCCLLM